MKNILFTFLLLCSFSIWAMAQDKPLIQVEGTSEIKVLPDEAQIQVNLMEKALNVADVTNALNKKSKSIDDALKNSGVKDYEFTADNYYVNVNRIYTQGTSKDSGYVASQTLNIVVRDLEKDLVKIVETLHQTADMGFRLNFRISEKSKASHAEKLLEMALLDARRKADLIANTMGIKDIKVYKINYTGGQNNFQPVQVRSEAMMMKMADDRTEPTFNPQEQKVSDRVMVSFSFE